MLLYHVATSELESTQVVSGNYVTAANGLGINVTVDGSTVLLNTSTITTVDINATNGVIHVIDAVMLPPDATQCCEYSGSPTCADNQCIATVGAIDSYCVDNQFDNFCAQCARGESYDVQTGNGQTTTFDCSDVGNACGCDP